MTGPLGAAFRSRLKVLPVLIAVATAWWFGLPRLVAMPTGNSIEARYCGPSPKVQHALDAGSQIACWRSQPAPIEA